MNGLQALLALQRARDAAFSLVAARGFATFGAGTRILLPFRVGNPHRIAIGARALIGSGSWLMVPARGDTVALTIGDRVRMRGTSISAVESVVIEDGVALAHGVYISDHAHGFEDPEAFIRDQPLTRVAPVRIGRGAWLGQNVVVLPGVTIGAGAVVGANSVVRADVPARAVAAGVPARVLRELAS
ncbi:acyltransferase [Xylanimonas ulmi]|uniref:Transferase family hexapeptide repeat protein n=1 Tax=Xylanimonas ulmi TaxID=228973 RepID=A0A4Q7M3U6_9MICO|nr:acyltransferase [Xylanibacterium ulmi]RZS62606.1 transferase family hexapeptide repeat protein [Xylanibacterium ulmi]